MSLTRKTPTAAKRDGRPKRQDLVQALAEREAELAEARRQNTRLFDDLQTRSQELTEALEHQTAASEVLSAISRSPTEVQPVFDAIARSATELCGATSGGVDLLDHGLIRLVSHYNWSREALEAMRRIYPAAPSRGFASARAILTRSVVHIPDISKDPEYTATPVVEMGFRSVLAVPMVRDGQPIGSIALVRLEPRPFTDRQITLLQTFVEQAVIAINNVRLFEEVQARTREVEEALKQQTATADVLKVISRSAFDLQTVLHTLVESAAKLCDADKATITRELGGLYYRAESYGFSEEFMSRLRDIPVTAERGTVSGRALLEGVAIQVEDVQSDPEYTFKEYATVGEFRTCLAIPMLRNGAPIGVLVMLRGEVRPFNNKQIELVQTFADQAVIAIENVRLFDEVQAKTRDVEEALEQQTASAEILRVISSSPTDVRPVFETIVQTARKLCDAERASVHILRDGAYHAIAVDGRRETGHDESLFDHPILPGRGSITGRVVEERSVVHIHDVKADSEFTYLREDGFEFRRTMLGVPFLRDSQVIGVIVLQRSVIQPFTKTHIDLVTTFADQAVIAVENARLFGEVQAKTRDLEESLQQQTATADVLKVISRSAFDLQAVFEALISSAVNLMGGKHGTIYVRDGENFRIRAHFGVSERFVDFLARNPPTPGMGSASGRVMLTGKVVVIPDILQDKDYTHPANELNRTRSMLAAPLLRNDRLEGVLVIARTEPGAFSSRQIELVETFADQAVIAVENARLFGEVQAKTRDLEESLQQQTATADVLKVISRSAFDLQAVLHTLVESAAKLCDADKATITRQIDGVFYRAESYGFSEEFMTQMRDVPVAPERGSISGRVMLEGKAVHVEDVEADPDYWPKSFAKQGELRTGLGIPMMRNGAPIGVLALMRTEVRPFNAKQIELVQTFADQAVIAIENARLFDEVQAKTRDLQESLEQQTASAEILRVISSSPIDVQPVFDAIAHSAAVLCEAANGTVFRLRDGLIHLVGSYSLSSTQLASVQHSFPLPLDRGTASGRAILERGVVHIRDIAADPEYSAHSLVKTGLHSVLSVPMLRNGEPIGSINVSRDAVRPFSERQIDLLKTFADQAVIAINNVGLFNETREALEQQKATADVLKVISRSAFDLDAVLQTLTHSARSLSGAASADVEMLDGDVLRIRAQSGCDPELVKYIEEHPPRRGTESVAGRVLMTGEAAHIPDVLADPDYDFGEGPRIGNYRALLGAPLIRDGKVDGVFTLMRPEPGAFTPRQIEIVQTFADQAVIAIENARLFDEVRARTRDLSQALEQQTATAEVLKVISRSAFDLNLATSTILGAAAKLCRAPLATLHLRDGEVCRLITQFGLPEPFERQARENPIPVRYPLHSRRPAQAGDIAHFSDAWTDPDYLYKQGARLGGYRALVVIPLMREGELVGIFSLGRPEPEPFTESQIKLTQTFADQAAIAVGNARLFDEVQARTRDLEEALQQQTATANVLKVISRSAFDLQAVLTTLAESARELCGASFVTLFMRNDDEMRLRAESGCTPEIVAFLHAHPIKAGRETFTGRVMLSREPVHLPDVLADPEYDFGDAPRIGNYRTLLGVPLLRDGQVEGVFALARPEPMPFTARQIEMVRAFADQAVIAIENSRLFEEVQARTRELAASLDDLRKAQDRLIQSEKLASLGQLTAGIAHEIKNPLNFINNYSALSRELIDELADAIKGGADDEAAHGEADELIGAIGGNLDKIVQHGKRADSIVKNMLLHSREGSGERSTTNVNAMIEEALNLAYHGARAEKPGFNVTIMKSLDPNAGAAEVYAQEMTRVLLNLISNGFYATTKRKQSVGDGAYEPTIAASTRDLGSNVEIAIRDNGAGIPDEVKAKMFNPFFTTKPAGEGTGLGLSLSHDIVVKQHGGAIEVLTELGAFTQFTIVLPRGAART
jgi:two-component system, NtrC family, sensor kinase